MSKILNRLYVSGSSGSNSALSINSSTASSALMNIVSPTASQDIFRIRTQSYNLTFSNVDIISTFVTGLSNPYGIKIDSNDNLYIADSGNNLVKKVDINGNITIVAGNGSAGFSGDGGLATSAQLDFPIDIAIDSSNNLYISDFSNYRIRKVDINGVITTYAGAGGAGSTAENIGATAAYLNRPYGLDVDKNDNLYVSLTIQLIVRKIDKNTQLITTVAGNGSTSYSGDDGPATSAGLGYLRGIAFDSSNNLYISAQGGSYRIRKVSSTSSIITTFAGSGATSYNGDILSATFSYMNCFGICFDKFDNLYTTFDNDFFIRKITRNNFTKVISGSPSYGDYGGDGSPANSSGVYYRYPRGINLDSSGNIYIADYGNNVIRKITLSNLNASNYLTALNPETEKVNNLFSIDGSGVVSMNGTLTFKDINFSTQSYRNASGNTNNFILQDGSKISSPFFQGTEFSASGSAFWMEPGYSKTWNAYSMLGDVSKMSFTASSFATGSLISFNLIRNSAWTGLTFSEILNVAVSANNTTIYPTIIKTYSNAGINLTIDTYDDNVNNLSVNVLGRNLTYASYSVLPTTAYTLDLYIYNAYPITYSISSASTPYFTNQVFTASPYKLTKIYTATTRQISSQATFSSGPFSFYFNYLYSQNSDYATYSSAGISYTNSYQGGRPSMSSGGFYGRVNQMSNVGLKPNIIYVIGGDPINTTVNPYGYANTVYMIRYYLINTTQITQSVSFRTLQFTQSFTIQASASTMFYYPNDSSHKNAFRITNNSIIGATFSTRMWYTIGNFNTISAIAYNGTNSITTGNADDNLSSVTTIGGTQSSFILVMDNKTTTTYTPMTPAIISSIPLASV